MPWWELSMIKETRDKLYSCLCFVGIFHIPQQSFSYLAVGFANKTWRAPSVQFAYALECAFQGVSCFSKISRYLNLPLLPTDT